MKSWTKIVLGVGLSCFVLGAGLTGYGLMTGGLSDLENDSNFTTTDHYNTVELEDFDQIDIDTTVYDVVISKETIDKPFISYLEEKELPVTYGIQNGKLTIKQTDTSDTTVNFFSLRDLIRLIQTGNIDMSQTIVLSVPESTDVTSLKASLSTGDMEIHNLSPATVNLNLQTGDLSLTDTSLNSGKVEVDTGDVELAKCQVSKVSLSIATGDVNVSNSQLSDSSFDLSIGNFSATAITFTGNNHLSLSSGDVDITLASKDVTVTTTDTLGDEDITSDLNKSSQHTLTVDGSIGDISIQ